MSLELVVCGCFECVGFFTAGVCFKRGWGWVPDTVGPITMPPLWSDGAFFSPFFSGPQTFVKEPLPIKEEAVSKTNGGQGRFMVLQHLGRTGRGGNERPGVHSLIFCLVGRKNRRVLCLSGCAPSVSFLEDGSLYYETTLKHFYAWRLRTFP